LDTEPHGQLDEIADNLDGGLKASSSRYATYVTESTPSQASFPMGRRALSLSHAV
jgi:hypothetical protein